MTIANITLKDTAAIKSSNSLTTKTLILDVKEVNGKPVLIGGKQAAEYLIKHTVNEHSSVHPDDPNEFLSDDKYSKFIEGFEEKIASWWQDGKVSSIPTWYLHFTDATSGNILSIDISLERVSTIKLNE